MMKKITYLAAPYSRGTPETRAARFEAITHVAARLIEQERIIFSPLTMTHPIDLVLASDGETLGTDYWLAFDEEFMRRCDDFAILKLPGWDESTGVARETEWFKEHKNITPEWLNPSEFGVTPDNPKFKAAF